LDQISLVKQEAWDSGQRLISRLEIGGMRIKSAFWMYQPEQERWRLVLATTGANVDLRAEYRLVSAALAEERSQSSTNLTSSDIEIVKPRDRTVTLLREGVGAPASPMTEWRRSTVRGNIIEDALIYRLAA
jgi:hypothetical protein